MKRRILMTSLVLALALPVSMSFSPLMAAGGEGRGGGGTGIGGEGGYGGTGQWGRHQDQRKEPGIVNHDRSGEWDRIRATNRQQDRLRTCLNSAERIRVRIRNMEQATQGKTFNLDAVRQQREQLRNEIRSMVEEHNRFMQGLNAEQRAGIRERIVNIEKERERLTSRFQQMTQEIDQSDPDQKRIARQTREMENAMNNWRKEYQHIGSDFGVESMQ